MDNQRLSLPPNETAEGLCLDPLPEGFMLAKPVNSVPDDVILKLERAGRLAITRKRDGYRVWAVRAPAWKLYTRGLNEVTVFFPHIVKELEFLRVPPYTFFDGEMILEKNGKDDFPGVEGFFKTRDPQEAARLRKEIGIPRFMIFDVIFWNREKFITYPWRVRYEQIRRLLWGQGLRYIFPIEKLDCSFEEAQRLGKEHKWEGLVLYDTEGQSDFRLDGKVARPPVCWKRKPVMEDDFIVRRWIARDIDPSMSAPMLKEFILSQIDEKTGKEMDCGKCGTGFSNIERMRLADETLYPLVAQVQFFERFKSGKLRFPVFLRVRDDKKPEECTYQKE